MGSAVLTNSVATHVKETNPTTNYDTYPKLPVRDFTNTDVNTYMWWANPVPLGVTVQNAEIIFYTLAEAGSGSRGFKFTRLAVPFSASKVTYNTRPVTFITGDKTISATRPWADKREWRLNVTDWMQTIANGGKWYGVRVVPTTFEDEVLWMYSELWTDPALRPRLEVTWADKPQAPSGLSPSGGRAVGVSKPVVRGSYRDVSGAASLLAVQVQINPTDAFTAPAFDSGTVLTSVPELDLSRTDLPGGVWGGLADGVSTFWRLRFQDASGKWSDWSASTSFKRDDLGSLSVSNPPSGTPIVEDATPPIAWSLSGETQAAYQVQVKHVVNGVDVIDWDTGKVTGTATSLTVPVGAINEPSSTTYTVTVRTWDTKDRESTPNSPTYVEVVRNFTFVPGATTGTTSLTAVADLLRPKVVLTWLSATFPDRFNVLRNGKVIAAALDPNDTFVSGTTHTWTDNSPSPKRSLTYAVQRVVNNVASASNSTAVAVVTNSDSIWLREPVSGLEVCIRGRSDRDFTLGESGTVLQAIGPDSPKLAINQTLSGLEGKIEGELWDVFGRTVQQWRDDYIKMRQMRVKRFWLSMGDYTFSVVCQEFTYGRLTGIGGKLVCKVSFNFYQQDSILTLLSTA